jgi:hypothetical protein
MDTELILKLVGGSITLCGLGCGLFQYWRAQRWKRMEFAASLLNKIDTDPDLRLAIIFLDWRERDVVIPEKFLYLTSEKRIFHHTFKSMAEAFDLANREINPETEALELRSDKMCFEYSVYVETMDRFFEYLAHINAFIEQGLIEASDVSLLHYWLVRIKDLKVNGQPVFAGYLDYYFKSLDRFTKRITASKSAIAGESGCGGN